MAVVVRSILEQRTILGCLFFRDKRRFIKTPLTENYADDVKSLVALAAVCLAFFLPICILTPSYYADDGGYMRMLGYFTSTGKVDLMHWSQPTAIGMLVLANLVGKAIGFGFAQMDFVGLSFSIVAVLGVYTLARSQTVSVTAVCLALSIFCFNEVTLVTPTFMTDMPFLAYCIWCLVFTERLLRTQKAQIRDLVGWSLCLLLALLTRSTAVLILPALLTAAIVSPSNRRQLLILSILFIPCALSAFAITNLVAINQPGFLQTTALRQIFQLHDFGRFNLRAASLAVLSVIFSTSPLLLAVKMPGKEIRIAQVACAIVGGGAAVYFTQKGLLHPLATEWSLLVIVCIAAASANLPTILMAAISNNKALSMVLIAFLVLQFAVMPIMAHPLTRHAIPGMVAMVLLIATANSWQRNGLKIMMVLSTLLILNNVIVLQQVRLTEFATLELASSLLKVGFLSKDIDGGWSWFCYYALVPGENDSTSYIEKFKTWQRDARFFVGSDAEHESTGRLLSRLELRHLASNVDVTVVQKPQLNSPGTEFKDP